jgi:hypothetical protein
MWWRLAYYAPRVGLHTVQSEEIPVAVFKVSQHHQGFIGATTGTRARTSTASDAANNSVLSDVFKTPARNHGSSADACWCQSTICDHEVETLQTQSE